MLDPVHMKYGHEKVLAQSKESTKTICQQKLELEAQIETYNSIVFDGGLDAVLSQYEKVVYDEWGLMTDGWKSNKLDISEWADACV